MLELRSEVVWAVGWKIIAELFRRHHQSATLRLYETHPCCGQYDCLSLYSGSFPDGSHLCDFNQASSHFHVWGRLGNPTKTLPDLRWPDENNYVMAYLQSHDPKTVIDQVESVLGLPPATSPVPVTTAPVLCIRLIAESLARCVFDRRGLDARNGFSDSSGMAGSGVRDELRLVPAIASRLPASPEDAFRFARRFWLLRQCATDGNMPVKAILDMRGIVHAVQPPYKEVRVWELYQANHRIHPLVDEIATICGRQAPDTTFPAR